MDISIIQEFIKPELLVLAVAMYFIGIGIKNSKLVKDEYIPLILGLVGIVIAGIYVFASSPINSTQDIFLTIFTSVTQGVLCAAASVYINQLFKQAERLRE